MSLHLVIGNRLYSSWSLRAWMVLKAFDIPFQETVIAMYKPDTRDRMLEHGPTGKVPVLQDGDVTVWESLAIIEHVADRFPDRGIWPADQPARSHARAASSEMHAGFSGLRSSCPMNLAKLFEPRERDAAVKSDVRRLTALWREARERFGDAGPFLYGAFSGADAMYAPAVSRLETYGFDVPADIRAYMDAVLNHPAFLAWREAAYREPWSLPHYEEGERVRKILYTPDEARDAVARTETQ